MALERAQVPPLFCCLHAPTFRVKAPFCVVTSSVPGDARRNAPGPDVLPERLQADTSSSCTEIVSFLANVAWMLHTVHHSVCAINVDLSFKPTCSPAGIKGSSQRCLACIVDLKLLSMIPSVFVMISFAYLDLPTQIPSVWGPVSKSEDPFAVPNQGCQCLLM